jgi:dTDP-4-dehydrorhamnose 3,5-epimerase
MKPTLLDTTLAAAKRDQQMVTADGKPLRRLTEGVIVRDLTTHTDDRGSLVELFDPRWQWHPDPLVYVYSFTIRPGVVKGWNLHKEHEDRYCVLQGDLELVLYDPRPESKTHGEICKVVLSGLRRQLINVPRWVWHADHNVGTTDVVALNFPTLPYDHANPDKYRLPIDTDLIPHKFPAGTHGY